MNFKFGVAVCLLVVLCGIAGAVMFDTYGTMEGTITVRSLLEIVDFQGEVIRSVGDSGANVYEHEFYEISSPCSGRFWVCTFYLQNNGREDLTIELDSTITPSNVNRIKYCDTTCCSIFSFCHCSGCDGNVCADCARSDPGRISIEPGQRRITVFIRYPFVCGQEITMDNFDITTNVKIIQDD